MENLLSDIFTSAPPMIIRISLSSIITLVLPKTNSTFSIAEKRLTKESTSDSLVTSTADPLIGVITMPTSSLIMALSRTF